MRVGFIGSEHSTARLAAVEARLPGIELRVYPYSDPQDTVEQYSRALAENDAVCFSGTIAHYHRQRDLDGDTPVLVGRFSDYTLVSSLLTATSGERSGIGIADLSIDLPNPDVVASVADDTGIRFSPEQISDYRWVYEPRFSRPIDVDEIARFHTDRAERAGARLAITSVHAVYDRLSAAGVPVMFMVDSLGRDLDLIRAARQRVSVRRLEGALLAVVSLTSTGSAGPDRDAAARRDALASELSRFATPVQHRLAAWQRDGLQLFYTTRGELDARLPGLLALLAPGRDRGDSLALGVGVGQHLHEAEDRSLQALRRALSGSTSAAYLVDEEARVHGPLGGDHAIEESRHTAPWLVELSSEAGMQTRTVSRLLSFVEGRGFRPFTAAEWASASQTSARTAERAIKKLLEAGGIVSVGQEKPLEAGRPRTVYGLSPKIEAAVRELAAARIRRGA